MLSIGKLTPGRADYYVASMPGGADEYYLAAGETPGRWLGAASGRLGLAGRVTAEEFRRVLDATHPRTGEPLGAPTTTTDRRVAGFDLTFSAPKSVSLAWALGHPATTAAVAAAHDRAVADAIDALEADAVRARRGAGGDRLVETGGVVAAAFGHRTSRAGDPQLHTHVVVANLTPDADGRWSAIYGARVYRWAKTLGYLYQSSLRHHLTHTLGMGWGPVRNGMADLAGVTPAQIEAFSARRSQIAAQLERFGATTAKAAQTATLATRPAKIAMDLDALRRHWSEAAVEVGLDPATIGTPRRFLPASDRPEVEWLLAGLTEHASSFDRRDVLQSLAQTAAAGRPMVELRADADGLWAHPDLVALGSSTPAGPRATTRDLLAIEDELLDRSARRRQQNIAVVDAAVRAEALAARPTLSGEQQTMVASLTGSGDGVQVVIGRAGAGKTFALDAARDMWQRSGHPVIGAALAARAAAELQAGAGIPSVTLERLLADLDRPSPLAGLAPGSVVVVDEAGMVGTRALARLAAHVERAQAKLVLVGDPRQLSEIDAGGALAALTQRLGAVELVDNRRQHHPWERAALAELRAGHVPDAVTAYVDHGRLTLAATADAARAQLVDDWWAADQAGERAAMYALRRRDVDDLNHRARTHLHAAGLLGPDTLAAAGRDFAVGDRILCLRNDRHLGVRNGTTGTVTALHPETGGMTIDAAIRLPATYLDAGHVGYGYATTIHKAQGVTVDRAFVLGSDQLYREAGYVGLSRARARTDLYLVAGPPERSTGLPDLDPVADLTRRLGVSRAQTVARDQHPQRDEARSLAELHAQRARLLQHVGQLPDDERVQAAWLDTHAAHIDAARDLSAAIANRHQTLRRAAVADPPVWLVEALGPPPVNSLDRQRWADRAELLAAYRDTHHITGPDPLGPEPTDPGRHRDWEVARLTIRDHHHQLDQTLDLDQGLGL